jgi:chemotaxis protein CheD
MQNMITVGLGEAKVSRDPGDVLVALGLGSCVGLCAYDPTTQVAGMLHAVLPERNGSQGAADAKYVDTGIRCLLEQMERLGANRHRIVVCMAGGAEMLIAPGFAKGLRIGARNVEMAHDVIRRERLRLTGEETGGSAGRTVRLFVESGKVTVRSVGSQERTLAPQW